MDSPCYELERIILDVTNPFDEGAEFNIVLVEASNDILDPDKPTVLMRPKETKKKVIKSKVNHGQNRPETPPMQPTKTMASSEIMTKKKKDGL